LTPSRAVWYLPAATCDVLIVAPHSPHLEAALRISATHIRALVMAVCAAIAFVAATSRAQAPRVEFPSAAPGATPYAGANVYPSAPAGMPVYPSTPAPTSVYPTTPPPTLPTYPPLSGATPTFDPYANPSLGSPPADVPYASPYAGSPYTVAPSSQPVVGTPFPSTSTPFTGTPAPATGSTLFQNSSTPQWSNSATYNHQNSDGTVARLQRFLQQLSFEQTYLWGDHNDIGNLAWNRTELAATFGVPIFYNPNTPLLITPGFAFNWLSGPSGPDADLPPRLYDAYLDTAWYPRFSPVIGADLGFRTGVWSDFEVINSDSVRFLGRGLGVITLSPRMDVLVGVWYLDRNDVKILPAGGLHWKPNTEWDIYAVFPNPKVRKRFVNVGSSQWWWYVAGEYGGGRWTIQRSDDGLAAGADDDIDVNDIRVIGGFEWETATQARGHVEAGYVFDRQIIYGQTSQPSFYDLDDTWMVRVGVDF
jgi:hypothetical protein